MLEYNKDKLEEFKKQNYFYNLYLNDDEDYVEEEEDICMMAEEIYGCEVWNAHGISKFVIMPETENYVIKMPIGRVYHIYDRYDEEAKTYVELTEVESEYVDCQYDYCSKEVEIYEKAKESNIEFLFAESVFCGNTPSGLPIYVQEKIYKTLGYDNETKTDSKEKADKIISSSNTDLRLRSLWLGVVIDKYGEDIAKKFITFCEDNNVNDLHEGNVGFRENGDPIVLDYSGYFS